MVDNNYDVIIIGAGSVGTPIAMMLSENGLKVTVIDRFASAGQGSNKTAIGGIRATHSDVAKIKLCQTSIEIFSKWKELHGDDIEWIRGGYLFVAYREEERTTLKELLMNQISYGLKIEWLDKQELLELVPDLNPTDLLGGTYSSQDGNASPLLANHAFFRRAQLKGATFNFQTEITGLIIQKDQIKGVATNKGKFYAPIVINAAGAWAKQIGCMAKIELPVESDSHEAGITEAVQRFFFPLIVDIHPEDQSSNFYFYQHYTGQVVFCLTPSPNQWGFDTNETSAFLPLVSKRLLQVMPCLQNIRVRRTWRGLYPMTPDGFPIIGFSSEVKGFLQAVGMCGQGFMLGPGVGALISRLINGTTKKTDQEILQLLSPNRQFVNQEMLK